MHPPISIGLRPRSGSMVVCNHGLTLTWGQGGSDLNCWFAFLNVCPTVLIPIWYPDCKKFLSFKEPSPSGLDWAHKEALSLGSKSSAFNCSYGKFDSFLCSS